ARTLGLVNVVGSTIAREVDGGIYLHAGPEIGVASTKAFTSQIAALAVLTLKMGRLRALSILQGREVVRALGRLPELVERVPAKAPELERIGERMMRGRNVLHLGRGWRVARAPEARAERAAAAAAGVLRRGAERLQRGPAAQSREECDGRVSEKRCTTP